jgi:hypothetical protein
MSGGARPQTAEIIKPFRRTVPRCDSEQQPSIGRLCRRLFHLCCEIERDSSSLDPERLSILVFSLEMVSKRRRRLESWFRQGIDE